MKKKLYLVLFLLIAVLAVTSCRRGDDENDAETTPTPTPTPTAVGDGTGDNDVTEETPTLPGLRPVRVLSWDDPDTTLEAMFYELYGGTIEWIFAGWDVYMETFLSMLMAGNPPDLLEVQHVGLNAMTSAGHLLPLDDLIDFNAPHWSAMANNPLLMHTGQHVVAGVSASIWYHLFYSRPMFFAAGEEYPSAALARGAWTWDRMFEMAANLSQDTTGDGFNDIWGLGTEGVHIPQMAMFATHQVAFIGQNPDGTFYNNVNDPTIARLLDQFYDAASVRGIVYQGSDGGSQFAMGNAAMFIGGYWYFFGTEEDDYPNPLNQMLRAGQVGMVPTPSPGGTLDEPRMGNIGIWGIPRNANNPEGAAVLLDLMRRYIVDMADPETGEEEMYLIGFGFTPEWVGFVYNIPIVPYTDLYHDFPWWDPFFGVAFGYEWTAMREGMWADVQFVVDQMNDDL